MKRNECISLFIFLIAVGVSSSGNSQDFNINNLGTTIINNQMMNGVVNRSAKIDRAVTSSPISPAGSVTDIQWRFDAPPGWTEIAPSVIEGPDGIQISLLEVAKRPSERRSKEKWLRRRIDVLFAGERIIDQDRSPDWRSADTDTTGVLKTRLWTERPDGVEVFHILQAAFQPNSVRLFMMSSPSESFERNTSAIGSALNGVLGTLVAESRELTVESNPIDFMAPEHVSILPGISFDMQPGMKHRPRGKFCAWKCMTFDPDPQIVVHEPLPLPPEAAIATLSATWDDPVVDRIKGPILDRWFAGTSLSAELFHELNVSFTRRHLLIPITSDTGTVIVELTGKEEGMFGRLPTVLALIDSMRFE